MIAIAIDDEQLMLHALVKAVKASDDIDGVEGFSNCDEALDWLEINTPDVAFLDINMRGINGIGIAENYPALGMKSSNLFCNTDSVYTAHIYIEKCHIGCIDFKPVKCVVTVRKALNPVYII